MQYITTPQQAEHAMAKVMRSWGFPDAVPPPPGADGGIDVRSSRALAQVKWKGGVVPSQDIQKLYGARGTDTSKALFFFSAAGYSKPAIKVANELGIALFTYDPTGQVTPVNGVKVPINVPKPRLIEPKDTWLAVAVVIALIVAIPFLVLLLDQIQK